MFNYYFILVKMAPERTLRILHLLPHCHTIVAKWAVDSQSRGHVLTSPVSLGLSLDVTEQNLAHFVETEALTVGILWDGTTLCPEGALQIFSGSGLFRLYPLQSVLVMGRIVGEKGETHLETRETCKILHQALAGGRSPFFLQVSITTVGVEWN